jgi:hypothetical protein
VLIAQKGLSICYLSKTNITDNTTTMQKPPINATLALSTKIVYANKIKINHNFRKNKDLTANSLSVRLANYVLDASLTI